MQDCELCCMLLVRCPSAMLLPACLVLSAAVLLRHAGARLAEGDEPMNLLDAAASRQLVRTAAGMRPRGDMAMDDFQRDVQVGPLAEQGSTA